MKNNITPEEKLLRILEGPSPLKKKPKVPIKNRVKEIKNLGIWLKRLRINKNSLKQLDLRTANKILSFLCAFFTFFCIFDFITVDKALKNRLTKIKQQTASLPQDNNSFSISSADIKQIVSQTRKRNIFTLLEPKVETIVTTSLADMIKSLKLVGILWSEENPQVMVEDTKETKTYLLSVGEMLGELQVKKILKDKVIVGKDDVEWEIR